MKKEIFVSKPAPTQELVEDNNVPFAEYDGLLQLGQNEIGCAVLNDGRRVLTQQGVLLALGRSRTAKGGQGASVVDGMPAFLAAKNLRPFITEQLKASTSPIIFKPLNGGYRRRAFGYTPDILKLTCQVYVDALNKDALHGSQVTIAENCRDLLSALESLALVALIDEATGYQQFRAHNELQKLLDLYVSEEFRPWTKRFPDEYYKQLFRLLGWGYDTKTGMKPKRIGQLTDEIIYKRLPVGVRDELRKKNPVIRGSRRRKHHQLLTNDIGEPHLEKQLTVATTIMRGFDDIRPFLDFYDKVSPRAIVPGENIQAKFNFDDED